MGILNFYRIPWHVNNCKPKRVLKLIVVPLCTSLLTFCISLNILIYVLVNFQKFSQIATVFSYTATISASVSFILFILAVVYGNYIFLIVSTLLQFLLFSSLMCMLGFFWALSDLKENIDVLVFNVIKYILTMFCVFLVFLEFRLILVSIALGRAMYMKGVSWDLDDFDTVNHHFKSHSILIH